MTAEEAEELTGAEEEAGELTGAGEEAAGLTGEEAELGAVAAKDTVVGGLRLGPRGSITGFNVGETSAAASAALDETVEELAGVDVVVKVGGGGGLTAGRAGPALTVTVFVSPDDLFLTVTS